MNFTTHNQTAVSTDGCCGQGEITATYDELTSLFGSPTGGDGYKVDAYWQIKFEDGTVATIYNWKNGKNYCGEDGEPVEQITDWHIGGRSDAALTQVQIALDLYREQNQADDRDPIEKALEPAIDMMDSLRANKGENYARLVEIAMCVRKMQDVTHAMIGAAIAGGEIPEPVGELIAKPYAHMMAKVLALASRMGGIARETGDDYAEELMSWADKIMEAEKSGAERLLASLGKKGD